MLKGVTILMVAGMLAWTGCTPVDESVVKRANLGDPAPPAFSEFSEEIGQIRTADRPALEPDLQNFVSKHGRSVRRYASKYGFDWRLILAVVKQESRFTQDALSHKGASGYMQIMPHTGKEVAEDLSLENLDLPEHNLKGGVYYLRTLYDLFEGVEEPDRTKLALAAYNAGIGRIYDAQQVAAYLNENPNRWEDVRDALPLLSKRYYTLHRNIWAHDKPRAGWFGNARETVDYVDLVLASYEDLRLQLN